MLSIFLTLGLEAKESKSAGKVRHKCFSTRLIYQVLNSLIILVSWEIRKHGNTCVFEGASPNNIQELLQTWGMDIVSGAWWALQSSMTS